MASMALRKATSSGLFNRLVNPIRSASLAPSGTRSFNTNDSHNRATNDAPYTDTFASDDRSMNRSDRSSPGLRSFDYYSLIPSFSGLFGPSARRGSSQILDQVPYNPFLYAAQLMYGRADNSQLHLAMLGSSKGNVSLADELNMLFIKGGSNKESRGEEGTRRYSTGVDTSPSLDMNDGIGAAKSLRPLSPHLAIYKPQRNSTFSIANRISGIYLSAFVGFYYLLYLKLGPVCFSYDSFYQLLFHSSKLTTVTCEIGALAMAYHTYYGIRHLIADFSGRL